MVNLGPFFPPGTPTFTWEADNPLAYFNLAGLVLCIMVLVKLRDRRGESSMVDGVWASTWVLAVGTGLHFIGDIVGVAESWDHQFIHLVVMIALLVLLVFVRRGD